MNGVINNNVQISDEFNVTTRVPARMIAGAKNNTNTLLIH